MIYSTCSLNPLEDEAVVCALLKEFRPQGLHLVTERQALPNLVSRPGVATWRCDKVFLFPPFPPFFPLFPPIWGEGYFSLSFPFSFPFSFS